MSAIPWYKSKIIVGAGIGVLGSLLKATGIVKDIPDELVQQVTDVVVTTATVLGPVVAVGARVSQKEAPVITASKGTAEVVKEALEHKAIDAVSDVVEDATGLEVPKWMVR